MQYADLAFNVSPVLHQNGFPFPWVWLDAGCIAFMGGILAKAFLRDLRRFAPLPLRDPRLSEAMGLYLVAVPVRDQSPEWRQPGE